MVFFAGFHTLSKGALYRLFMEAKPLDFKPPPKTGTISHFYYRNEASRPTVTRLSTGLTFPHFTVLGPLPSSMKNP